MDVIAFSAIALLYALFLFLIGRCTCPKRDRLRWRELDRITVWTTVCRGWCTLGQFAPLTRVIGNDRPKDA